MARAAYIQFNAEPPKKEESFSPFCLIPSLFINKLLTRLF